MPPTILITGGTSGLGYELVQRFSAKGYPIVFTSRNKTRIDKVLKKTPGNIVGTQSVVEAYKLGNPGIIINNAACSGGYRRFVDSDVADVEEIVATNLSMTAVTMHMGIRDNAHVFNLIGAGSNGAATANYAMYGATKAGIEQLMQSLMAEGHKRIHTISPGMMPTPLLTKDAPKFLVDVVFPIVCEEPGVVADKIVDRVIHIYSYDLQNQHIDCFDVGAAVQRLWKRLLCK